MFTEDISNQILGDISGIVTAWQGHGRFACWLVKRMNAKIVVDLGIDYGYSTFAFAASGCVDVYGIDYFEGDPSDRRNTEVFVRAKRNELLEKYGPDFGVTIMKGTTQEHAREWNNGTIDILHIDALHSYEAVKADFYAWARHCRLDSVVLIHDVNTGSWPGPRQFFNELQMPKIIIPHTSGLGVVTLRQDLLEEIRKDWL